MNSIFGAPESSEQRREELAVLEGHDADIPTEVQGSSGVEGAHTDKDIHGSTIVTREAALSTRPPPASSANPFDPVHPTHDSSLHTQQGGAPSSHDLAPSTIAQWVPSTVPDLTPSSAVEVATPTDPEQALSSSPEAAPSTLPETVPSSAPEVAHSTLPEHALRAAPEAATSSTGDLHPSTNGRREKATPASSETEKEMDLEANGSSSSSKKEPEVTKTEVDPNIVDWNGADDPQNPINWSEKMKWGNVAVIASITFLTFVYHLRAMLSYFADIFSTGPSHPLCSRLASQK